MIGDTIRNEFKPCIFSYSQIKILIKIKIKIKFYMQIGNCKNKYNIHSLQLDNHDDQHVPKTS